MTRCLHPASRPTGFAALRPKDLRPSVFLPSPFTRCVWVFTPKGLVHVGIAQSTSKILAVFFPGRIQVVPQFRLQFLGKGNHSMLASVDAFAASRLSHPTGFALQSLSRLPPVASDAIMHGNGSLPKIDVLYPEAKNFSLPHPATIAESSNQLPWLTQKADHFTNRIPRHHGWRPSMPKGFLDSLLKSTP